MDQIVSEHFSSFVFNITSKVGLYILFACFLLQQFSKEGHLTYISAQSEVAKSFPPYQVKC